MSSAPPESPSPFTSYETMLEQEVAHAEHELARPALGLFLSGLVAGFGVSVGVLLIAALLSLGDPGVPGLAIRLTVAAAYATGFILVIMGRTDLFTEYTTMAILPVLVGRARVARLARLWGLVFTANLLGALAFSALAVALAPPLRIAEPAVFARIARDLVELPWWVVLLSGSLTGWLMGLLSWLVSGARDTTSQILFVGLVTGTIGLLGLHHSITGAAEVMAGVLTDPGLGAASFAHFLLWTTAGNVAGGVVFAVLIRYSVVIGNAPRSERSGGPRGSHAGRQRSDRSHR